MIREKANQINRKQCNDHNQTDQQGDFLTVSAFHGFCCWLWLWSRHPLDWLRTILRFIHIISIRTHIRIHVHCIMVQVFCRKCSSARRFSGFGLFRSGFCFSLCIRSWRSLPSRPLPILQRCLHSLLQLFSGKGIGWRMAAVRRILFLLCFVQLQSFPSCFFIFL